MTCDELRRRLLEAPPARLGSPPGGELGAHLEACPECRRAVALVERATRDLDAWLGAPPTPLDTGRILERAGAAGRGAELPTPTDDPSRPLADRMERAREGRHARSRTRAGVLARFALPLASLAAAAGLAALLVSREPSSPDSPAGVAGGASDDAPGLALDVGHGRDAAVLATSDPDITVVWFLSGD